MKNNINEKRYLGYKDQYKLHKMQEILDELVNERNFQSYLRKEI